MVGHAWSAGNFEETEGERYESRSGGGKVAMDVHRPTAYGVATNDVCVEVHDEMEAYSVGETIFYIFSFFINGSLKYAVSMYHKNTFVRVQWGKMR